MLKLYRGACRVRPCGTYKSHRCARVDIRSAGLQLHSIAGRFLLSLGHSFHVRRSHITRRVRLARWRRVADGASTLAFRTVWPALESAQSLRLCIIQCET